MRAALLCLLTLLALAAPAAAYVPAGKTLLVIGQSGVDKADAVEEATGVKPAGAMWYLGVYEEEAAVQETLGQIEAAVASHPGLVVNLGLSFGSASTPSPPYTPAIAAGAYDATLRELGARLKALPTAVHVRPGYEFDLFGGQYGPPEAYKSAYRHVADVVRAEGATNVRFVWHSAGAFWRAADPSLFATGTGTVAGAARGGPALPIAAFYPGREYVDAFGISYWQDSCCAGRSAQQSRDEYEHSTRRLLAEAQAMGLPLHVSESTPAYIGASSGADSVAWLDRTFQLVEDFDIRSLSLIAIDWKAGGGFFAAPFWNGYWPDARIHAYPDTRERFLAEMKERRWLTRSEKMGEWLSKDQQAPSSKPRSTRCTRSRRTSRARRSGSWRSSGPRYVRRTGKGTRSSSRRRPTRRSARSRARCASPTTRRTG